MLTLKAMELFNVPVDLGIYYNQIKIEYHRWVGRDVDCRPGARVAVQNALCALRCFKRGGECRAARKG